MLDLFFTFNVVIVDFSFHILVLLYFLFSFLRLYYLFALTNNILIYFTPPHSKPLHSILFCHIPPHAIIWQAWCPRCMLRTREMHSATPSETKYVQYVLYVVIKEKRRKHNKDPFLNSYLPSSLLCFLHPSSPSSPVHPVILLPTILVLHFMLFLPHTHSRPSFLTLTSTILLSLLHFLSYFTSKVRHAGIPETPENMWTYYVNKCRSNLHIVFAMSPSGSKLRIRCRYPNYHYVVSC